MAEVFCNVRCSDLVFDLDFAPDQNIVYGGLVTGAIEGFSFQKKKRTNIFTHQLYDGSVRVLQTSEDGTKLYSGSSTAQLTVSDLDKNIIWQTKEENKHSGPVSSMYKFDDNIFITGDDEGEVRLWDLRDTRQCVKKYKENEDYISCFDYCKDLETLLYTSADGTLNVINMKNREYLGQTDCMDDELLSVCIVKENRKVVVGTQEGVLDIWSWGKWDDFSDRIGVGHPQSVDCILKLDESTVITGSCDGVIRVVGVQPNKLIGVLGNHQGFPVEKMKFNKNRYFLGTTCGENLIKIFDTKEFVEDDDEEEEEEEQGDDDENEKEEQEQEDDSEESEKEEDEQEDDSEESEKEGSEDSDSDEEDSDDSDSDDKPKKKRGFQPVTKSQSLIQNKKSKRKSFFDDL